VVGAGPAPKAPDSCSTLAADEPLAGTAPFARAWIAIEQPGSWGRDALRSNSLPFGIGPILADRAKAADVGILLIRHPNRPRHLSDSDPRIVWVAHIESNTLKRLELNDCRELLTWDLPAIAHGDISSIGALGGDPASDVSIDQPLALICCHAARDACCAIHGRALYDALLADATQQDAQYLWQCSHLGGHRFAPTMLLLPLGALYGRLDLARARSARQAACRNQISLDGCRGRTHEVSPVQCADLYLRQLLLCQSPADLEFSLRATDDTTSIVSARHCDGRTWSLAVAVGEQQVVRPASCGAEPESASTWQVTLQ